ncbi:type II secretion system inner membrane protein GspF [Arenicella xantha]|uniref:Type II secretion system protein F (GspF) n=1 Tax=Arenicella xantha TaxID=644221 RepID=A0A395JRN6_9GAMM|nr:type II secretion system inner membrane protein GspF [Arenicella xantha]RBP51360.1 type II secretion system protein F (GspF) [Arenicella xantha]
MATFEYQALNAKGKTVKGVTSGDHAKQVRSELRAQGLIPLDVKSISESAASKSDKKGKPSRRTKISVNDLSILTRQMATLLESGMTVEETLSAVIKQSEGNKIKTVMSDIRSMVTEGYSLSDAIAHYPNSFPEIYRASISAGEQSGTMDSVLERLADYLEDTHAMQQKVTQAIVYPIFLFFVCSAILVVLIVVVVPKIVGVYEDTNQELPGLTKIVIKLSEFMVNYGVMVGIGIVLLIFGLRALFRKEKPRLWLHRLYLKTAGIRKMVQNVDSARMSRTLSIMVGSGVPILSSMRASEGVMTNRVLQLDLQKATEEVSQGVSIGRALDRGGNFPPLLVHMVTSGENSGRLGHMLEKAATATENEMQTRITMMVSLLGPMMILVMGSMVLTIILAILMPMFQLNEMINF